MRQAVQQKTVSKKASPPKAAAARVPGQRRGARQPIEQALARAEQSNQRDLLQALKALQHENVELRAQLRIDHLTGVFNRFALNAELEQEWQRGQRSGREAALLLIDLNDFKLINDQHGHAVGDRALISAADYFAAQLRSTDLVARLGGDEFAILLRDTDNAEARRVAIKLCANAPSLTVAESAGNGECLQLSFAIGVAVLAPHFNSVQEWLDAADRAMYRHKREGRGPKLSCVR
ncbi:MAG TPA: GGDEF domain-containing protein [Spongiibacteraceae bacterium]|nr:GGDEF domain-containing protein [Spongiibacteraceae bacterium]